MELLPNFQVCGATIILQMQVDRLTFTTDDYGRAFDVINRGLGGYNTKWAIPEFKKVSVTLDPAWC